MKLRRPHAFDAELSAEVEAHLELLAEKYAAQGLTPGEARAAARREFGNPALIREAARESWGFPRIESILQDLRYGARGLRRSPGFSLAVILTLALGIGATTSVFSVLYSVLLRPLPYPHGERLVRLGESTGQAQGVSVTWINLQHWRAENHSFEGIAGYEFASLTMTGRGEPALLSAASVTNEFLELTGARPVLGRMFGASDDRPGAPRSVVLSYDFWRRRLGADPNILSAGLTLNGDAYQVLGVLRSGDQFFSFPVELYVPLGPAMAKVASRSEHGSIAGLALLKPGVTLAEARRDLDGILARLLLTDPGPETGHRAFGVYLAEARAGGMGPTLAIFMSAAALLLLLACANVASLLLVRGTARTREMAIRTAIGAGSGRLARQLLTENLLLAVLGGACGVLLAEWSLHALLLLGPETLPRLKEVTLDWPVLAFAAAVTVVTGLLAGMAPAWAARRVDVAPALKEASPGAGRGRHGQWLRSGLVVAEIAVTLVLSFGAGLLLRSLLAAQATDPGFDHRNLLALDLQLPPGTYKTDESRRQFFASLLTRLRREPGVVSASAVGCPPAAGDCGDYWYSIVGKAPAARGDVPLSLFNTADEAYFRTMRIPLLAGREFRDTDRETTPKVAIVNREFARHWWARPEQAIGQQIKMGGPFMPGLVYEIVGVSGDLRQFGLDRAPEPEAFFPLRQRNAESMVVAIRTAGDPAGWVKAVHGDISALDPNLPIHSLKTFDELLGATLARRRFSTFLLLVFAGLAMLLAAVGVYGVLNYWVSVRQRDIAIRMAVGAPRATILGWAAGHAAKLAGVGMVTGAFGGWLASRALESLIYGVPARNPAVLGEAVLTVVGLAATAAIVPVWRATRVDVMALLHDA